MVFLPNFADFGIMRKLYRYANYAFLNSDINDDVLFPKDILELQKYKQLGNLVIIPVIGEIALFIQGCVFYMDDN